MNTERLAKAGNQLEGVLQQLGSRLQALAQPERLARLRAVLLFLAALWAVSALVQLIWSLVPAPAAAKMPDNVLNPLVAAVAQDSSGSVNIDSLVALELFGRAATGTGAGAGAMTPEQVAAAAAEAEAAARAGDDELDGIEKNAKETRLALTLQGVVASSEQDKARAIIEAKREQAQYAVGDELPIAGVKLAKVLRDRVVLDNKGRYELLTLFDLSESPITASVAARPTATAPRPAENTATATIDRRNDADLTRLAESYRQRLYENPQSLAQVVNIAPERNGSELIGYRVRPGRDSEQFSALGFKQNDIVTGVNGISLSDPSKAIEIYQAMKTANEASFEVLRDGQSVTVMVGLDGAAP
ncbi:MAG: type II secretion system protein GspC [Halieaceae bacterium]|nr:type II secretion system protein GspC [Halieaceae bacterium]